MARLSDLTVADLNDEQRAVLEAIQQGPRKNVHGDIGLIGPFNVWVRAPNIGMPAQSLGEAIRFATSTPENVKEVAICTVGAQLEARFEFAAHQPLAEKAGVDHDALERLRTGKDPGFKGDEALAHRVASELLSNKKISDATYAEAVASMGETGMIELVAIIGCYSMVAFVLNAFEIPLVDGMTDPFPHL